MKNWSQNLLFILFSFLFMGLGMLLADFYIKRNGNPFKQDRSVAAAISDDLYVGRNESSADSTTITSSSATLDSSVKTQLSKSGKTLKEETSNEQKNNASPATLPQTVLEKKQEKNITNVVKEEEQSKENSTGNMYVITGVFGKESNAKAMIQKLKHFGYSHAFGFPRKKLTAVTAGSFSKKEAAEIKNRLTSKGLDAVVMEK